MKPLIAISLMACAMLCAASSTFAQVADLSGVEVAVTRPIKIAPRPLVMPPYLARVLPRRLVVRPITSKASCLVYWKDPYHEITRRRLSIVVAGQEPPDCDALYYHNENIPCIPITPVYPDLADGVMWARPGPDSQILRWCAGK
jgi:hypothetical protein